MSPRSRTAPKKDDEPTTSVAEPGSPDHLGERPYADEPADWKDDRDDVPGTSDHLGDSPYAGASDDE
jgi:hypothetical protein